MSRFIGIAPLFIVLTPTAFFLASPPAFGQFLGQRQGLLHRGGTQLLRLGIQMGVDVRRGGDVAVAQPFLDLLHGYSLFQQQAGAGVPLRYNYDKPEKPRRIKGFEVFSLIFSSFSKPKNHTEISRIAGGVSLTTNE